jgi:hypothetical protein
MNDMPSSHSGHLRHVSHLSYLSTISNLNILNPYPLDSAPTDRAFITELNLEDPCLPEGYYEDDLLNPLPITTPLLPAAPPSKGGPYVRQIDAQMGMTQLNSLILLIHPLMTHFCLLTDESL